MSLTVSAKEYSELEKKHLRVTSEMYSDIQKLREEKKRLAEEGAHATNQWKECIDLWNEDCKRLEAIRNLLPLFDQEADKNDEAEVPILWLKRQLEAVLETSIDSASLRRDE